MKKLLIIFPAIIAIVVLLFINTIINSSESKSFIDRLNDQNAMTTITAGPTPNTENLTNTDLPQKDSYTIIIVGDSMVDALGANLDHLRIGLKKHYPNKTFGLFNYGYSSTNLTTLMDRLTTETEYKGQKKLPILSREFDIIIIESFGHNPLSQQRLTDGLIQQDKLLKEAVTRIRSGHPNSVIIFLATIGANNENYARGTFDLTDEQIKQWADERNAYIENHISFAKENNIPVINVYENTLTDDSVDPMYVNEDSWIHPSETGVRYISQQIADHIFNNEIIPHD